MSRRNHQGWRSLAAGAAVILAAGCSALPGRGKGGPYLDPGPLPVLAGGGRGITPALPGDWGAATAAAPAGGARRAGRAAAPLPAGLIASDGMARLPGARVPGVGPVQALVVPVSLGGQAPVRDEAALLHEVFGGGGAAGGTLAEALLAASGGKFRLSVSAVAPLVDRRPSAALSDAGRLRALALASLRSWSEKMNLAAFDNDGADGVPASGGSADDDGVVDLLMVTVESDRPFPSLTLRDGVGVPARGRRGTVNSGPIHVLGLEREGGDPLAPAIGLVLDALGLEASERFFPTGFPRMISTLARVRLGWIPTRVVEAATAPERVPAGEALLIHLKDMPGGSGFWLLENDGRWTFASRVVRTPEGRFAPTEVRVWEPGRAMELPLSRQLGVLGERVVVNGLGSPMLEWVGAAAADAPAPERKVSVARW